MPYLNHAGTSWPKPAPVRAAAAAALDAAPDAWGRELDAAHRAVAAAFGIGDPARLLLTPGCTSALALGIGDLPWERGDRIVVSAFEHHALHRAALALAARGVEVVVAPGGPGEPVVLEQLASILRASPVRLVATTAASNVTGELLPVRDVAALAHAHGALCLIDAAQVAGWLDLDVAALGADLLAFAGHKALQGPWGVGGLYVAPHIAMASPEASCELPARAGAARTPTDAPPCAPMPGYCDAGSIDRAALAGLAAGLRWLAAPERRDRLARARRHGAQLTEVVTACPAATLHGARDPERRLPTLAFTVAGRTAGEIASALTERGVVAGAGLQCAPLAHTTLGTAPDGVVRLSVGPTTDDADVEQAAAVLRDVLG